MSEVGKWQTTLPRVIGKAWADPAFERLLVSNPKAALHQFDLDPPDGMDVQVVQGGSPEGDLWKVDNVDNKPVYTLTLPDKPDGVSEEQLLGADGVTICCSVCCCC